MCNDLLQASELYLNPSSSFSDRTEIEIAEIEIKAVEYESDIPQSVLASVPEFITNNNTSDSLKISDNSDLLTGNIASANHQSALDLAIATAQNQLKSFANNEKFLDKMNLAFGDD